MDLDVSSAIASMAAIGKSSKCCGYGMAGADSTFDCVVVRQTNKKDFCENI